MEIDNINIYEEFKKIAGGIVYIIISMLIIAFFNFSTWQLIGYLIVIQFAFQCYIWYQAKYFNFKSMAINSIIIVVIVHLFAYLSKFGRIGFILVILLASAYIIALRWKSFNLAKKSIEKMIWGKPLSEFKSGKDLPKIVIGKRRKYD